MKDILAKLTLLENAPVKETFGKNFKEKPTVHPLPPKKEKQINYAHRDDPKGDRFNQYKKDKVPDWAIDVKDTVDEGTADGASGAASGLSWDDGLSEDGDGLGWYVVDLKTKKPIHGPFDSKLEANAESFAYDEVEADVVLGYVNSHTGEVIKIHPEKNETGHHQVLSYESVDEMQKYGDDTTVMEKVSFLRPMLNRETLRWEIEDLQGRRLHGHGDFHNEGDAWDEIKRLSLPDDSVPLEMAESQCGEVRFRSRKSWLDVAKRLGATVEDDFGDLVALKGDVNIGVFSNDEMRGWLYDPMGIGKTKTVDEGARRLNHMGEAEYETYAGWKAACRKAYPGCTFRGDIDIGAAVLDGKDVGEWDGAVGSVYAPQPYTVASNDNAMFDVPLEEADRDMHEWQEGWYVRETKDGEIVDGPYPSYDVIPAEFRDYAGSHYELLFLDEEDLATIDMAEDTPSGWCPHGVSYKSHCPKCGFGVSNEDTTGGWNPGVAQAVSEEDTMSPINERESNPTLEKAKLIRKKIRDAGFRIPYTDRMKNGGYSLKVAFLEEKQLPKIIKKLQVLLRDDNIILKKTSPLSWAYSGPGEYNRIIRVIVPPVVESEESLNEKAPPGMEADVLRLKKEYPGHPEKAFATAWMIYNKKHGKTDESTDVDNALDWLRTNKSWVNWYGRNLLVNVKAIDKDNIEMEHNGKTKVVPLSVYKEMVLELEPEMNEEHLTEKSKTKKQAKFMAACAHGAGYSSCPPMSVSKDFNKADQKAGTLKNESENDDLAGDDFIDDETYNRLQKHVSTKHPGYKVHGLGPNEKGGVNWQAYHINDKHFTKPIHGVFDEGVGQTLKKVGKSIKRGVQLWDKDLTGSPRDVVTKNKGYSDKELLALRGKEGEKPVKHSPRHLQNRVIDKEIKKRGLENESTECPTCHGKGKISYKGVTVTCSNPTCKSKITNTKEAFEKPYKMSDYAPSKRAGAKAHEKGMKLSDNPHRKNEPEHDDWAWGYKTHSQQNKKMYEVASNNDEIQHWKDMALHWGRQGNEEARLRSLSRLKDAQSKLKNGDNELDEVAPKGWEGTVKKMKKHPEIDNPWALANYMKKKGYKSHVKEENVDEVSKKTLGSYVGKAADELDSAAWNRGAESGPEGSWRHEKEAQRISDKRLKGIKTAAKKLVKMEETATRPGYKEPGKKISGGKYGNPSNAAERHAVKTGVLPGKEENDKYMKHIRSSLTSQEKKATKLSKKNFKKAFPYGWGGEPDTYYGESKEDIMKTRNLRESLTYLEQINDPALEKLLRHYGKEVKDFIHGSELADDLYHALYDFYFDEMPYGTKKARTGDPFEWITERLDKELKGISVGHPADEHEFAGIGGVDEGSAGDPGDACATGQLDEIDLDDLDEAGGEEYDWHQQMAAASAKPPIAAPAAPAAPSISPAQAAANRLAVAKAASAARTAANAPDQTMARPQLKVPGQLNADIEESNMEESVDEAFLVEGLEGVITEILEEHGLDHGLDFFFDNGLVAIGKSTARVIINALKTDPRITATPSFGRIDGEEVQIAFNKEPKSDVRDLNVSDIPAADIDVGEHPELSEEITEEVSLSLTATGEEDALNIIRKLSGLSSAEPVSAIEPETELVVEPEDELEIGPEEEMEEAEGEYVNAPDPEVHTSTTDMINRGTDLSRPKKQDYTIRNLGNNPMSEARKLMKQYEFLKQEIKK